MQAKQAASVALSFSSQHLDARTHTRWRHGTPDATTVLSADKCIATLRLCADKIWEPGFWKSRRWARDERHLSLQIGVFQVEWRSQNQGFQESHWRKWNSSCKQDMPNATNIHSGAGSSSPSEAIQAENARLQALIDHPPQGILTLSDFHLVRGRNPSTGRFSRTENFLSDQAFSRLLTYSKAGAEKLLFINGDTFDFARIFRCPSLQEDFQEWSAFLQQLGVMKDAAELQKTVSRREKRFGLETDDYKSAWKLLQIANGHREFFVALANWINAGGLLLLSKGNHDLELYWPLVRKAFGFLMKREGAREDSVRTQAFY